MMANRMRRWLAKYLASPPQPCRRAKFRPQLETLEQRDCPAVFNVGVTAPGVGNVAALIAAFQQATTNNQANTIVLADATYTLTAANNTGADGANGLPVIGLNNALNPTGPANLITVDGNGAIIMRSATAFDFRILEVNGGRLLLDDLTISNGATSTAAAGGGGVFVTDASGVNGVLNNLVVENSLFTLNTSESGNGGAIDIGPGGKSNLINTTVSGNFAHDMGGGITQDVGATLTTLTNDTIAHNVAENTSAAANAGGGINVDGGAMIIDNTIVALNVSTSVSAPTDDLYNAPSGGTVYGRYSLFQSTPTGAGLNGANLSNRIGQNPLLGPLQNNGGNTETQAIISAASPAVDNGNNAYIEAFGIPLDDQRGIGFNRLINGTVDMGAYEYQPPAVAVAIASSPQLSIIGSVTTFGAAVAGLTPGSNVPQGTFTFYINGVAAATVAVSPQGTALFSTTALPEGINDVYAVYNPLIVGDYGFSSGVSPIIQHEVVAANIPPLGRRWNR
jgi:hypothetical protein